MFLEIRALKFAVPLIGILFFVAACSSDSSGGGGLGELQSFFVEPSQLADNVAGDGHIVQVVFAAANARPIERDSGDTSVTFDDGTTYVLDGGDVSQSSNRASRSANVRFLPEESNVRIFVGTGIGSFGAERGASRGDTVTRQPSDPSASDEPFYLYVRTDTPNSVGSPTDYLAYGFWILGPDAFGSNNDPLFGAFVDSNAGIVFPSNNLEALSEEATYEGAAEGLYYESTISVDDARFQEFRARVSLEADFGDDDDLGSITGTIHSFTGLNDVYADRWPALAVELEEADLVGRGGGLFTGDTDGPSGSGLEGQWGGKFYDDTATGDADHPGTVAGTFGFGGRFSNDVTVAWLGVYWADLEE